MKAILFRILIAILTIRKTSASAGDYSYEYQNCYHQCREFNCTGTGGVSIKESLVDYYGQTFLDKIFMWSCKDECQYGCMWRTVDFFQERNLKTPQFYGKWPFLRFLGFQEPASVLFSIGNLLAHVHLLRKFRAEVRPDSPCFKLWHLFTFVSVNGWIWSTVFHTRDFPVTEFLDYTSAYLIVLTTLYCFCMRMVHKMNTLFKGGLTLCFIAFYYGYFLYLSVGKFSYSFNMKTNIATGILSGLGWLTWCFLVRKHRPYYKLVLKFYCLLALSMVLEISDFPPIFWVFDAHALWHLSTIPIAFVLYRFLIEDCKALRKEDMNETSSHEKLI
ncbi:PGAP3 family protein [Megaselia abdita]